MDGESRKREEQLKKEKAVMSQQIELLGQQLEDAKDREKKLKASYYELLAKVYTGEEQTGQGFNLVLLNMLKEHLLIDKNKLEPGTATQEAQNQPITDTIENLDVTTTQIPTANDKSASKTEQVKPGVSSPHTPSKTVHLKPTFSKTYGFDNQANSKHEAQSSSHSGYKRDSLMSNNKLKATPQRTTASVMNCQVNIPSPAISRDTSLRKLHDDGQDRAKPGFFGKPRGTYYLTTKGYNALFKGDSSKKSGNESYKLSSTVGTGVKGVTNMTMPHLDLNSSWQHEDEFDHSAICSPIGGQSRAQLADAVGHGLLSERDDLQIMCSNFRSSVLDRRSPRNLNASVLPAQTGVAKHESLVKAAKKLLTNQSKPGVTVHKVSLKASYRESQFNSCTRFCTVSSNKGEPVSSGKEQEQEESASTYQKMPISHRLKEITQKGSVRTPKNKLEINIEEFDLGLQENNIHRQSPNASTVNNWRDKRSQDTLKPYANCLHQQNPNISKTPTQGKLYNPSATTLPASSAKRTQVGFARLHGVSPTNRTVCASPTGKTASSRFLFGSHAKQTAMGGAANERMVPKINIHLRPQDSTCIEIDSSNPEKYLIRFTRDEKENFGGDWKRPSSPPRADPTLDECGHCPEVVYEGEGANKVQSVPSVQLFTATNNSPRNTNNLNWPPAKDGRLAGNSHMGGLGERQTISSILVNDESRAKVLHRASSQEACKDVDVVQENLLAKFSRIDKIYKRHTNQ